MNVSDFLFTLYLLPSLKAVECQLSTFHVTISNEFLKMNKSLFNIKKLLPYFMLFSSIVEGCRQRQADIVKSRDFFVNKI